ncbi:MAG: rhodanese-like domain-containing protein [Oscillospiraceae bacterium]
MFFGRPKFASLNMGQAKKDLEQDGKIVLVDVRTPGEYADGHLPHSRNIPLDRIKTIETAVPDKGAKLYVYCLSGARSHSACGVLTKLGYTDVTNIGGIGGWTGTIERGKAS